MQWRLLPGPGNVPRSIGALWLLGQNAACLSPGWELLVADDLAGLTYVVRPSPSELDHHVLHLRWRLGVDVMKVLLGAQHLRKRPAPGWPRKPPTAQGERPIDFLKYRVVIFFVFICC